MMLWPSSPLEFARPFENSGVDELKRIRADSSVEAHKKISLALNSVAARVLASMTRIPVTRRVLASKLRLCTTLNGRSVILPVFCAAGKVALTLLKYERVMHPRSHGPQ